MTMTDCALPISPDTPAGVHDLLARQVPALDRRPSSATLSFALLTQAPGARPSPIIDRLAAAPAQHKTNGDGYAESSRELQRGLEVIEWHHGRSPDDPLPSDLWR